jgi:hypothetical protein
MPTPTTFESHYRVLNFGDDGEYLLLYDIEREESVWVNRNGYDDTLQAVVDRLYPGFLVEATLVGHPDGHHPGDIQALDILEETLAGRFNELCRKETILDAVDIDAETFEVILHRGNETFGREALSAGETQLFAIATIWALREVSGVPMPVIIDTPLGRLDDDHRSTMIQTYLPRASHQVMLLATDAEVDEDVLGDLEPALSHTYRLRFDEDVQRTQVDEIDVTAGQQKIFEEVAA